MTKKHTAATRGKIKKTVAPPLISSPQAQFKALPVTDVMALANRLCEEKRFAEAIALYRTWLDGTDSPVAFAAHFNLGVIYGTLEDLPAAEAEYRKALAVNPEFPQARLNLGTQVERQGRPEEALEIWREVLKHVKPEDEENRQYLVLALNNLGRVLEIRRKFPEAESMLRRSLDLDPSQTDALTHYVHLRQKQCKWPAYEAFGDVSVHDMMQATSALAMLSAATDPADQLRASQTFVQRKVLLHAPAMTDGHSYGHKKLRIGYLSSDLCSHAVSILAVELFELHDREQFEVYAFSWSREDGTPLRKRVVAAFDHYVPIHNLSDEQAARAIRDREIDVLIDLQGLTSGTRPNILSYRPAPLQITYLGFPGPTGLPEIDYVVADRFLIPEELQQYFTEKPLYMPNSFQINDRKRAIGPKPTRAQNKLPEDAFVFCSFNNNFKITPEVFDVWMNVLKRVPGSVLWLVADVQEVHDNLAREAKARGVDPARLIFAERVQPADYLARYQIADLFLDTTPFNAGTTASDALWAGLPLLTWAGRTFSSRMAGSLLHAVGLPELISFDAKEFEDKAVALANDRARVEAMKKKLVDERMTCPLFDSPRFVKDLEAKLQELVHQLPKPAMNTSTKKTPQQASKGKMTLPDFKPLAPEQQNRVLSFMTQTVWGLTDPARFYQLMEEAKNLMVPGYYIGDNLITWGRNNSLFDDESFRLSWEANQQNDADRAIAWRRYILATMAYHCAQLEGDFVECGVYRGTGIKTVIDYFGKENFGKNFWGYDTFDYNPVESHAFAGQEDGLYDEICKRFDGYHQVKLIRGLLPESLDQSPDKIAYMHIDLNSAKYEIAVLDVLFDRMVSGGVLVLDDYEWGGIYREQKIAEDAWFAKRNYRITPLPTGQGMVIKR